MDEVIQNIATYIRTNIPSPQTYTFKRPSNVNSITIIPAAQSGNNVRMWSQETTFSIGVYDKTNARTSYLKAMEIRDLLLNAQGNIVVDGVRYLLFKAENTLPEVIDIAEDDNEIYGFIFTVKYIDNTIPV
jgi:hypothetical protein